MKVTNAWLQRDTQLGAALCFMKIGQSFLRLSAHWYSLMNSTKSPDSGTRTFAIMGKCHKPGEWVKSCARKSVCFCSQSSGGVSIVLLRFVSCIVVVLTCFVMCECVCGCVLVFWQLYGCFGNMCTFTVFTVFCIVCAVFLLCFVYVYLFLFVLSLLV